MINFYHSFWHSDIYYPNKKGAPILERYWKTSFISASKKRDPKAKHILSESSSETCIYFCSGGTI